MKIHCIVTGAFQTNCYILSNEEKECLIIDPGDGPDEIEAYLKANALTVIGYPTTHGHIDHVAQLAEIHRRYPAPIGLHPLDAKWAFTETNSYQPYYDTPAAPSSIERDYADGQHWKDSSFGYDILFVPGHSPGSVAFYFKEEAVVIAGDTLFKGSIGRLDLPGGNEPDMIQTLKRLSALPDETRVLPGHGPETTIGLEKQTNQFILHYANA